MEGFRELRKITFSAAPSFPEHLADAPPIFKVFWPVSTVVVACTVLIAAKHIITLFLTGRRIRRELETVFEPPAATILVRIFLFFPLSGVLMWAAIFCIRFTLMFDLLMNLYEVACLLLFWDLMIDLLDGPEKACRALSQHEPRRIHMAFPFLLPCCPRHRWRRADLVMSYWAVAQYGPFSVVSILSVGVSQGLVRLFSYASLASLMVCMWGLCTLFNASKRESQVFRLGFKFVTIKATVLLYKFLELLTIIPGVFKAAEGEVSSYDEVLMAGAWKSFLICMIALPATIVAVFAYPTRDINHRHIKHSPCVTPCPTIQLSAPQSALAPLPSRSPASAPTVRNTRFFFWTSRVGTESKEGTGHLQHSTFDPSPNSWCCSIRSDSSPRNFTIERCRSFPSWRDLQLSPKRRHQPDQQYRLKEADNLELTTC